MELEPPEIPFEDVKKVIEATYRDLWEKIFGGHPGLTPATLEVHPEAMSAGYRQNHNTLILGVGGHDLVAWAGANKPECDPQWLSDLVHEMLHEYQTKVVKGAATPEGRSLRERYRLQYPQQEHDECFFTGVPFFAETVKKPVEDFVDWIAPVPW